MAENDSFPKITERELDRLRRVMNVELEARDPFNRYASPDTIRHFAHGIGDDNPLFADEEYAASTRWGEPVAPPTFLFSCFGRGAPQGLRGIHSMWGGASFDMRRPITSGTRIAGTVALSGLTPKQSRFAAKSILQEHLYTFKGREGDLLAKVKEWHLRTERDTARRRGKHRKLEPASYSAEEIEEIFRGYENEEVRGGETRFWEDTAIGEELPTVVKGPLRVTDNVAWKVGWGFRPFTYAHKLGVDYYRRHPMAFIPNYQGVPDVPERVHWDENFARRVGVPTSYDFGPQRVAWLGQVVTNWMGDDGFIVGFWGEVRRFNLVGDTHWLRGEVAGKEVEEGRRLVSVTLSGVDQRGEETIRGGAEIELPTRQVG